MIMNRKYNLGMCLILASVVLQLIITVREWDVVWSMILRNWQFWGPSLVAVILGVYLARRGINEYWKYPYEERHGKDEAGLE